MSGLSAVLLSLALLLGWETADGPLATADEFQGWFEDASQARFTSLSQSRDERRASIMCSSAASGSGGCPATSYRTPTNSGHRACLDGRSTSCTPAPIGRSRRIVAQSGRSSSGSLRRTPSR